MSIMESTVLPDPGLEQITCTSTVHMEPAPSIKRLLGACWALFNLQPPKTYLWFYSGVPLSSSFHLQLPPCRQFLPVFSVPTLLTAFIRHSPLNPRPLQVCTVRTHAYTFAIKHGLTTLCINFVLITRHLMVIC